MSFKYRYYAIKNDTFPLFSLSYYIFIGQFLLNSQYFSTFYYVTMETQHIFLVMLSLETNVNFPRNMVINLKKDRNIYNDRWIF